MCEEISALNAMMFELILLILICSHLLIICIWVYDRDYVGRYPKIELSRDLD